MTHYSTRRNAYTKVIIDMKLHFIIENVFCQSAKSKLFNIFLNSMCVFELPFLQFVVSYHHLVVRLTQTDLRKKFSRTMVSNLFEYGDLFIFSKILQTSCAKIVL